MDKLSAEIVREILGHVQSKTDLARLRLVQNSFAKLVNEFLFQVIHVEPAFESLCVLLEISRIPELARCVKRVVLHVDDFRDLTWIPFNKRLEEKNIQDEARKAEVFKTFQALDRELFEFQTLSDYTVMLSVAFGHLSRLEAVKLAHRYPEEETELFRRERRDLERLLSLEEFHGEDGEKDDLRAFTALIDAAYFTEKKISSFRITGKLDLSVFENTELIRRAAVVFRNCRVLELDFSPQSPFHDKDHIRKGPLFDMLSSAVHLKSLTLCGGIRQEPDVPFSKYLGDRFVWKYLNRIDILGLDMHAYEFLGFLERHKKTLRKVAIGASKLFTGRWPDIMRYMKGHLRLTSLELGAWLEDIDEEGTDYGYGEHDLEIMEQFVTGGGERLPEDIRRYGTIS